MKVKTGVASGLQVLGRFNMKRLIIIINGSGGVGKDTLIFLSSKYFQGVENFSSIDFIKRISKLCGWDGAKDEKGRKLLVDMKKALVNYDNIPLKKTLERVKLYLHQSFSIQADPDTPNMFKAIPSELMYIHIREPEEIANTKKAILDEFKNINVVTLLIRRDTGVDWNNSVDNGVENYDYDYVYHNDKPLEEAGEDFANFVKEIIEDKGVTYL